MIGGKKKLREFAARWMKVAAAVEGKADKYAEGVKEVCRDLSHEFKLQPKRKPIRRQKRKSK
jgi:hypothetical protein